MYELSAKTAETISTDAFELELKPSKPPAPPAAAAPPASAPPNVPAVEKIEPPPLPGERPSHGVEHSMDRRRMVLLLAGVLAAAGLFLAAPAAIKLFEQVRTGDPAIPRWVYALLLLGGLHLAYACYVAQIPDWSTVWVVAVAMLLCSGLNAVLLAAIWLGRQDGLLVGMLELHDQLPHGRASGWCFIMLCLSSLFAYFTGRMAARWQAADEIRWKALGNQ